MTFKQRRAVRRRIRELRTLLAYSRQVRIAWQQELSHIERTGRLDWADPNPLPISTVKSSPTPPPTPPPVPPRPEPLLRRP